MAPRKNAPGADVSIPDFDTEHSVAEEPARPVINRKVTKVPKKRAVTMKKTRSPAATNAKKSAARQALKDRTNIKDTEEFVEDDLDDAPKKIKGRKVSKEDSDEPKQKRAKKTAASKKRTVSPEPMRVIPETQPLQDISESIEVDPESMQVDEPEIKPQPERTVVRARSVSQQRQAQPYAVRARSTSQQPRAYSREGSASLAERRLADAETRRKLADMTSKYEDMRLRYESLSELGTNAAESNFDKLKRATDQRTKDANELIASLKKELSEARKSSSTNSAEHAKLQTQLNTLQSSNEQAMSELKDARASLSEAQNEVKSLTAKLEAARKAASVAAVEAAKVPGSAIKSRDATRNNLTGGTLDNAKQAALKEELYRDLTGLIINSVKRKDGEDEYSCIQTGRNGTLHFHLTVNNDASQINPKTPSGLSYEDAEFAYEPFFDEGRDRDLIDILPDYLTEEICFPRNHAVKFYTKVVDSMTKKVVIEE